MSLRRLFSENGRLLRCRYRPRRTASTSSLMAAWVVGALIQLVGSVLINLGTNLMKLGYDKRAAAQEEGDGRPIYKYWPWAGGCATFALGNVCNFASYAFAGQALLTALSSVQFVSNVIFSSWLHGEKVRLRVLLATAIIIAGNIVLVVFASKRDPRYTALELRHLYLTDQFTIYLTAAFGAGVPIAYFLAQYGLHKMAQGAQLSLLWLKLTPVAYSVCSSLVGAQAVLFSTSLAILGRETLAGNNQLNTWFTSVLVVGLALSAIFWVTRLNQGLHWFDASVIIPMLQIIWIMLVMVSGNLYFQEFNCFSSLQLAMFLVGMGLLLLGIYCLTPCMQLKQRDSGQQHEEEDGVIAVELLGTQLGKASQAPQPASPPGSHQQQPVLCLLPALGQLDMKALMRLPHKHLLAVLHQLHLVPRTEEEARQLEGTLESIAWQQGRQPKLAAQPELRCRSEHQLQPEACPTFREQQPLVAPEENVPQMQQPCIQHPQQQLLLPSALDPHVAILHTQQEQAILGSAGWKLQTAAGPLRGSSLAELPQLLAGQQAGAWHAWGILSPPGEDAGTRIVSNPLFEEQAENAALQLGAVSPPLGLVLPTCSVVAPDLGFKQPPLVQHLGMLGQAPGSARPRQGRASSIAKLTAAARGAARGLRHSIIETVELMAGMGNSEHLKAASMFAMPMLSPNLKRATRAPRGLIQDRSSEPQEQCFGQLTSR